jgi:hypothetical protein
LNQYRADTVKHATSPSRRDYSQQVVIPRVFQIQSTASETKKRSAAKPLDPHPSVFTRSLASPSARFSDGRCGSLLFEARKTRMPRTRNFDTKPQPSYRYEIEPDNRLESVANAHTAADLHVRPVSKTALV